MTEIDSFHMAKYLLFNQTRQTFRCLAIVLRNIFERVKGRLSDLKSVLLLSSLVVAASWYGCFANNHSGTYQKADGMINKNYNPNYSSHPSS